MIQAPTRPSTLTPGRTEFTRADFQRFGDSEAFAECELEILRRAFATAAEITVCRVDGVGTIYVNGQEAVTYMLA